MNSTTKRSRFLLSKGFSLKALFVLVTGCAIYFGWNLHRYERGTIEGWIDLHLATIDVQPMNLVVPCPRDISPEEQLRLLMKAIKWLEDPTHRQIVLKIIAEQFPDSAQDCCRQIATESKDVDLQRNAIRIIGLFQDKEDLALLRKLLDSECDSLRAASIDAIGIIHGQSFSMPVGIDFTNLGFAPPYLNDEVPISLFPIQNHLDPKVLPRGGNEAKWNSVEPKSLPGNLRDRFEDFMVNGACQEVREAAARILKLRVPDDYHLRVAEWGVWINEGASLTLAESIIDEIPPFVHQSGNSVAAIKEGRTNSIIYITKPIIHIEVNKPLVVDLAVKISNGRPWFGYPLPDDFCVDGQTGQRGDPLYPPRDVPPGLGLDDLNDMRSGYPWLAPKHRKHYITMLTDIGFRWQTLVVMPSKADWMKLETVSAPKYQWWNRLREVPSSWVCNRGESERFLYYDGPTENPSPVMVLVDGRQLAIDAQGQYYNATYSRDLFFIQVKEQEISACHQVMTVSNDSNDLIFETANRPFSGDQVSQKLLELLVNKGLSSDEAAGLVDCWRPQFFETPGRRLLTVFGKDEYDELCPISVSPEPTELARVGIVLTELRPKE